MKIVANKVSYLIDSNGDLIVQLVVKGYHNHQIARVGVSELQHKYLLAVEIKEHRKARTYEQNNLLWALVSKIAMKQSGVAYQDEQWRVYGELLVRANVKREIVRCMVKAKDILEQNFRAVIEIPNSDKKTTQGEITKAYWVYYGSSKFTTAEMTQLIELALDTCAELGIYDSEIAKIKGDIHENHK